MLRTLLAGMAIVAVSSVIGRQSAVSAPRWPPRARIAVWLDPHAAPDGAGTLVERALATWTRAADGRVALQKTLAPERASIRIRFVQADGIYGEAAPRIDRATGYIGSAEVVIAGEIAGDAWQQRIVIYLTALHEFGHALGLPHTAAFDDIMYSFRRPGDGERYFGAYRRLLRSSDDIGTDRATGLSPADIAALKTLYDR